MCGRIAPARTGRAVSLVHLSPEIVERMQTLVAGRTDEALNQRFGISYNTWRKLTAGEPVRASLADRLLDRLALLDSDDCGNRSANSRDKETAAGSAMTGGASLMVHEA